MQIYRLDITKCYLEVTQNLKNSTMVLTMAVYDLLQISDCVIYWTTNLVKYSICHRYK